MSDYALKGENGMKTVELMYFSGTGNTKIAADMIAQGLRARDRAVLVREIGNESGAIAKPDDSTVRDADIIGIGAPVIGLGTPSLVLAFAKRLPEGKGKKAFIFRTAGGVVEGNYNASRDLRAILERKGYDVFHERHFSIGSNWVIRFSNDAMRKLHRATAEKIESMCDDIIEGIGHRYSTPVMRRARDALLRGLSRLGLGFLSVDFRVSESCTGCGQCARRCPTGNARMKGEKPRFGASCASCMRCVYACPQKAIALHRLSFLQVRGGYDAKDILEHPERWSDEGTNSSPPFLAEYVDSPMSR